MSDIFSNTDPEEPETEDILKLFKKLLEKVEVKKKKLGIDVDSIAAATESTNQILKEIDALDNNSKERHVDYRKKEDTVEKAIKQDAWEEDSWESFDNGL